MAFAINASGQVAGTTQFPWGSPRSTPTLWNGTSATALDTLGGDYSSGYAINASGQVAGYSYDTSGVSHAMLWDGTVSTDLNRLLDAHTVAAGWFLNKATGINDNGWIVGNASNHILGIGSRAFLMAPAVPEPESYAMMLIGLGLVGFVARRRKNQQA